MSARTTRVRGLAPWHPQRATVDLLDRVRGILDEYVHYLPVTLRQIFYRLVGAHGYDKTEKAYDRLGEHLNRARRAGLIPFSAIRDDGVSVAGAGGYDDAAQAVRSMIATAEYFRLDRQVGQPVRLMFAVEAAGMVPQVSRVASPYGIGVQSSGGFDSATVKYQLAASLGRCPRVEVLHIGDHDPSGVHMFSSVADDVRTFARDLGLTGEVEFTRLAVTPVQIAELGLPTAPAKLTDRRSFEGETVQAEAIAPGKLADIVTEAIGSRINMTAFAEVLDREERTREHFRRTLIPMLREIGDAA